MSSPKPVTVPPPKHVQISKTGRPFVNIGELIKGEMDRIEQSKRDTTNEPTRTVPNDTNGNGSSNGNGR